MTITPSLISDVIVVKAGDTMRLLYDQLQLDGTNINLSGSSVFLYIYNPSTDETTIRSGSVSSAISGSVQYQLTSGDIGTEGDRLAEWRVVDGSGKVLSVPTSGYIYWNIYRNLA
jgi:hypothetical protein